MLPPRWEGDRNGGTLDTSSVAATLLYRYSLYGCYSNGHTGGHGEGDTGDAFASACNS